tara:strand:+ start:1579 stop:2121 length:543 start_codon:yes stop_codon:yes gene_type:complete
MKFNYLIKALPFFSTLLLIICLYISNQKEYTKLRILIWNTPTYSLGSYIALSTGTGFILSYLITSTLGKKNQPTPKKSLKFKEDSYYEDIEVSSYTSSNPPYENTLIERNINDPSPTINASFRIIGKKEGINTNIVNNNRQDDESSEFDYQYNVPTDKIEITNQIKSNPNDWNDESYSRW